MIVLASEIKEELLPALLNASPGEPLYIHSSGGNLGVTRAAVDLMELYPRPTIASGECHSSALVLFAAGSKRYVTPNTDFLHHQASLEMDGAPISEVNIQVEATFEWERWANEFLASRSNKGVEWWEEGASKGMRLTTGVARSVGLAHHVLTPSFLKRSSRVRKYFSGELEE